MIRAVFFDVDDTLVDFSGAAQRALARILGESVDNELWEAVSRPHWLRYHRGEVDFTRMRVERTAEFLRRTGHYVSDRESARIEHSRMSLIERTYQAFDDVGPCLEVLRDKGLVLGVISNNDGAHQVRKLKATGLGDKFDVAIFSGDVGVAKPDAGIFRLACERVGVVPDEAVHIGDAWEADVMGARLAGLRPVWLDRARAGRELTDADGGIAIVHALGEVADLT